MPYILLLLATLLLASFSHAATFYINNQCANNGNGTVAECAGSPGGNGPWNTIKNALQVADCAGMSNGDILEIKGDTTKDATCENGGHCYFEDNVNIEGNCGVGIIVQNEANTHVVVDGTQDIQGSTWTSIGSGVYRCATSGCSGDVGDAFAFRAWYDRGIGEEQLDLIQTNQACNTTLQPGQMRIDQSDQSICVRLSDGSNPASAAYLRVPWFDPFIQAGADTADNMTWRRNPVGDGTFRIQRYRKRGIEANAAANTGWVLDGLEWAYMMDRCVAYADDEGTGNVQIINNHISFCGQEGIRLSGDNGNWIIENNVITDIQTIPIFERCAGIGGGCLSEFTDNGTGIRLVNHQGSSGIVRGNILLRMGGGMNNRARMINFEHDNNNIIVEKNYLAHSSGLVNTGAAIMWSGSFNEDTNDDIIVRNNLIYDVDRCFWIQYGTDYDSQSGTNNYILNNTCAEFKDYGLRAEASGSAALDGPFHIINNIFSAQGATPTQILNVQSSSSTGWTILQNNIFECDACSLNQDIINWRGTVFERDSDCTGGVDCVDNMPTVLGGTYTGNAYGDINVNIAGGTEPDLRITTTSEADDAGQTLALVTDDYTGEARPATYDSGAYNIGVTGPPTATTFDIAVRRFALNTGTGLQSFTFTDFTENCTVVTCAAIFLVTKAITEDTSAGDAMISLGFTDGTSQGVTTVHDNTGVSTTDSQRRQSTTAVIQTDESTGIDGVASFNAWLSNGVQIDITDPPSAAFLVTVVLIGGQSFNAKVGSFASNASVDGTTDVTSVGFEADAVLLAGSRLAGTGATTFIFSTGVAINDGSNTQGSIGCYSMHNVTTSAGHAMTSNEYALSVTDDGGLDTAVLINGWDNSGFTATTKRVGVSANVYYLALSFGGPSFGAVQMDSPTSTGVSSYSFGFQPLFGMILGTLAQAYNTDEADSDAGDCMISYFTGNNQYANTTSIQDGVTSTMNSRSFSNDQAVFMPDHFGDCPAGSCFRGTSSMVATGFSINYSSVFTSAARKWIGFAVEEVDEEVIGGARRRAVGVMQ